MKEVWKPVFQYEGFYEVSNLGEVRSLRRGKKILAKSLNHCGYVVVPLHLNGKLKTKTIHRLEMQSFTGMKGEELVINHKDGNKENNNIENLEWCTQSENMLHAYRTGLKYPKKGVEGSKSKLTEDQVREIRKLYSPGRSGTVPKNSITQVEIAKKYGVTQMVISRALNNQSYTEVALFTEGEV